MSFEVYFKRQMLLRTIGVANGAVGLFTNNGGTELSGDGYVRQASAFAVTVSDPIVARNSAALVFGPAEETWPTVTHVGIFDSAGNLLAKKQLLTPVTVTDGNTFAIANNLVEVGFV